MRDRKKKRKSAGRIVKPRSPSYSSLTIRGKGTYDRTTNLVTDLRRGEGSYTELLRKYHLGSSTARKYAGRDLIGGRGKPVRASKADRRVRELLFPKPYGDVPFITRSSRHASELSEFYRDRDKLLSNKLRASEFEKKWLGVRIAGQEVFADAEAIFAMADASDLKVENLYRSTGVER